MPETKANGASQDASGGKNRTRGSESGIVLIDGQEISISAIQAVMASLGSLVLNNPNVVAELHSLAAYNKELSPESVPILKEYGLLMEDGRLHYATRAIVKEVVSYQMARVVIRDILSPTKESSPSSTVDRAVASLTYDELLVINMGLMIGTFGARLSGYNKVAEFVVNGQPSEELTDAVNRAFAASMK